LNIVTVVARSVRLLRFARTHARGRLHHSSIIALSMMV